MLKLKRQKYFLCEKAVVAVFIAFIIPFLALMLAGCGNSGASSAKIPSEGDIVTPEPPDTVAPATSVVPGGGVYQEGRTVTLTANEAATIYYSVDGTLPAAGAGNTSSSAGPVTIVLSRDTVLLQFFAVDEQGNTEQIKSETYVISPGRGTGPGDPQNYFPFGTGNTWITWGQVESGTEKTDYYAMTTVSGEEQIMGLTATVLSEIKIMRTALRVSAESRGDTYLFKNSEGITNFGNNDSADTLISRMIPYQNAVFAMDSGQSFLQISRAGLDYGADADGDGANETADITSLVTMAGRNETVSAATGNYAACLALETDLSLSLAFSVDQSSLVTKASQTRWFAPGIGPVRSVTRTVQNDITESNTEELAGYSVDGASGGIAPKNLTAGETITGLVSPDGADFYRVSITPDVSYTIAITGMQDGAIANLHVFYGSNAASDTTAGTNKSVVVSSTDPVLYVVVDGFNVSNSSAAYTLQVSP
jgi:hypothetical protein